MSGVPFAYGAPTTATAARVLSVCCVEKPESTAPPFLPIGEFRSVTVAMVRCRCTSLQVYFVHVSFCMSARLHKLE